MNIDLNYMPAHVQRIVREYQQQNASSATQGDMLTRKQILEMFLAWEGIVGYTDSIIAIMEAVTPVRLACSNQLVKPLGELIDEIDEVRLAVCREWLVHGKVFKGWDGALQFIERSFKHQLKTDAVVVVWPGTREVHVLVGKAGDEAAKVHAKYRISIAPDDTCGNLMLI